MPSWNNLPEEILQIIFIQPKFRNLEEYYNTELTPAERYDALLCRHYLNPKDVLQCMSVCKGWKLAAERSFYRNLTFFNQGQITRILTEFEGKEQERSKFVKDIDFLLAQSDTEIFKFLLEPLATVFPYVEQLYFYENLNGFYDQLLHVRLEGKWKFLREIPSTLRAENRASYVSSALTCKNTLTALYVSPDGTSKYPYSFSQYNRLVSQLEHFTKLEELEFPLSIGESLQDLDSVVDKFTKLTTLLLVDSTPTSNSFLSPKIDVTKVKKSNITTIHGKGFIGNDHAMKYIMQKFENLESFKLSYPLCTPRTIVRYHDITVKTVLKFMDFLSKAGKAQVEFLVSNSFVFQLLDFYHKHYFFNIQYYDLPIQNHASLKDNDNNDAVLLNLGCDHDDLPDDVYDSEIRLRYNYTGQEMPHLELLERYGHQFKHLTFEFRSRTNSSKHVQDLTRGYFLDHIFKYCPNLQVLILKGWPLQRCNSSMSKNHSITSIRVDLINVSTLAIFYELSIRMVALENIAVSLSGAIRQPKLMFDVPYTNLDTMSLMLEESSRVKIGFKIMTENEVLFYTYCLREGKPGLVESNIEAYDALAIRSMNDKNFAQRSHLASCVRCKSIKQLALYFYDLEPFSPSLTITIP